MVAVVRGPDRDLTEERDPERQKANGQAEQIWPVSNRQPHPEEGDGEEDEKRGGDQFHSLRELAASGATRGKLGEIITPDRELFKNAVNNGGAVGYLDRWYSVVQKAEA